LVFSSLLFGDVLILYLRLPNFRTDQSTSLSRSV
jgi:hypothetical protein